MSADEILAGFGPYRPGGLTATKAEENLRPKVADPRFRDDLNPLVDRVPDGYAIETAAELVIEELLARLD